MIILIDMIVRYADRRRDSTPTIIPVKLIAQGSDSAPAPSVALHRLDIDPGDNLEQHDDEAASSFVCS